MEYIETDIKGVWIIEPKVFEDARGYFMEAWKKEEFEAHVGKVDFVQDNECCVVCTTRKVTPRRLSL